tara:strand:- start:26366 stop:27703 length:1338 start_codon:yes stop_codon:yes gene_type:complete
MVSYGLGDAGTGLAATQLGFYLFPFFIGYAGLPALIAGSILMLIKIWDAINDPFIGWLSDKTKTKWGPRIPWMITAAIPLGLSLAAIWWVPSGGLIEKTTYYVLISIILMTAYTSVNLPFAALSTEISQDIAVRTRLNAARFTGSILAGLSGLIIAANILSKNEFAYFNMGKLSGIVAALATLISCWGLAPFAKKARRPSKRNIPIKSQLKRIFNNKKFIKVITLYLLLWCALQLMQTVSLIYVEQVLQIPSKYAKWIPIPFQLSALLGLQIWSFFSNKFGRISALYYGALIWIFSCFLTLVIPVFKSSTELGSLFFYEGNNLFLFIFLILIICLIGIGASTAYLIPWSLLPDAIDEDPEKSAGLYTAWMVLIQKIGIGISVQVLGLLLSLSGYKIGNNCIDLNCLKQPELTQITIRICIGLIPSILVILGLLSMKKWDEKVITN